MKYIFVTGGVTSSLGKGIVVASLGFLFKARGKNVRLQKLDPYINVDPGTMNPQQHGEVFVTDDGTETDLDLGHYERFVDIPMTEKSNWTTGKIYQNVIEKERKGEYLGETVQVIPHITDMIKKCIQSVATDETDIIICEIGGTVGDIEGLPYLEAIRQMRAELGQQNTLFIHLTYIPYIAAAGELKTKPTQHSVSKLREIGIQPDILVCRSEKKIPEEQRNKISLFCSIEKEAIIQERDASYTIYEIPLVLAKQKIDEVIGKKLSIELEPYKELMKQWKTTVDNIKYVLKNGRSIKIGIVGKYDLQDAYKSIYEALSHAGFSCNAKVEIIRIRSEEIDDENVNELLEQVDGILIPGGFGNRGIEGKVKAIQYARENKIPFLGLCLGMQCAVVEIGTNVLKLEDANSKEFDEECKSGVICLMKEQKGIKYKGASMRLGAYECVLDFNSKVRKIYGQDLIFERHRHRYEFNNYYRKVFEEAGVVFSGLSPCGTLVEIIELKNHPWFVATQAHPEFKSRPHKVHPLFKGFIESCCKH